MKFVNLIFLLTCFLGVFAKENPLQSAMSTEANFSYIDSFAMNAPGTIERDPATIASYLSKACKTDIEKARAAFSWIAANIKYDDNAYNSGKIGDMGATAVLKRKHAVCEGYANVYKAIGEAMGLQVEIITGYAKAYGYRPGEHFTGSDPNHAWNAVKINGQWILLDATWGAGYSDGGRGHLMSHKMFSPYWFSTNNYEFLFMHYPKDDNWQLVPQKVTLKQFEEMPFVQPAFFQMGFDAKDVLDKLIAKTLPKPLVEVFPLKHHLKLVDFPLSGSIPASNEANFTILSDEDLDIEFVNDPKQWRRMQKTGNKYTITLPLKRGDLQIAVKGKGREFDDLLKYKVK